MFKSSSYAIGFLLASSLTANPLYASDSRPLKHQASYDVMADNQNHEKMKADREKLKEDRGKLKEDREKMREDHEKMKEDREKMKENREKMKENREHMREERKSKEGQHTGGQTTPPAHTSGSTSGGHVSGN
jgi:septal ring factor EnvC (AmiA/AmiB activator)